VASFPPFRLPGLDPGPRFLWFTQRREEGSARGRAGVSRRGAEEAEAQRSRCPPPPPPRHCDPGLDPGAAIHGQTVRQAARAVHGLPRLRLAMTKEAEPPTPAFNPALPVANRQPHRSPPIAWNRGQSWMRRSSAGPQKVSRGAARAAVFC